MPKVVDHDARRTRVLDATWRVVRARGLEGASVREIAQEAGLSMGAMTYYFADKDDLLIQAHRLAFAKTTDRVQAQVAGQRGIAALRAAILACLPLDADRELEAHVDVAFWAKALTDARLRAAHEESWAWAKALCVELLAGARAAGEVAASVDDDILADQALLLIDALSVRAVLDRWDAARLRTHVEAFLAGL